MSLFLEEHITSIIRAKRISELGTDLAVTSNRSRLWSLIFFSLVMGGMSVLTRATRCHIPEKSISQLPIIVTKNVKYYCGVHSTHPNLKAKNLMNHFGISDYSISCSRSVKIRTVNKSITESIYCHMRHKNKYMPLPSHITWTVTDYDSEQSCSLVSLVRGT
jgi:hypothetical protein